MAKGDWWLKLEIHTWLNDPRLRRLSRANRDSWLTACMLMTLDGECFLSGTPEELSQALHLSEEEFENFVNALDRTKTADVTKSHAIVTIKSRRYERELSIKKANNLRKQKSRSHKNVTEKSQDIVKSKSNSNKKEEEREAKNAQPETASPNPSAPPVQEPKSKNPKRGTRIPEPFILTAEMRNYAATKRPDVDVMIETEKFVNYWRSKPGKDGTKIDWLATWRNWILSARKYGSNQPNNRKSNADVFDEAFEFYQKWGDGQERPDLP